MGAIETARPLRVREPVEMSATLAINTRIGELRVAGHKVFHLGFGEARFPGHPKILDSLRAHADERSYLPVAGLPELRRRIAEHYRERFALEVDSDRVLVGAGSKSLLFAVVQALDGDVVLPIPSWVSYSAQVELCGKRVLPAPTSARDDYRLTPDGLRRALGEARAAGATPAGVIINSPNNPTGVVLSDAELAGLAEVARAEGLIVISDEIYALTAYGETPVQCMARHYPEGTVVTSGLSKYLSLGGWRLGHAILPTGASGERLSSCMAGVAGCIWTTAASPVQHAAVTAYGGDPEIEAYVAACAKLNGRVTRLLWKKLRALRVPCPRPEGGFYLYTDFEPWRATLRDRLGVETSAELAGHLLDHRHVAALPGSDFGADSHELTLRLSSSFLHDLADASVGDVLAAAREPLSESLLRRICPDALEVCKVLGRFVESLTTNKSKDEDTQ